MGVGLQPLEFSECLADSPAFRENLQRHEKELERTSQQIKRLIKEVKDVVHAAKRLGAAQLALAASMEQFEFACIGASMTEDERVISRSLHHFAALIRTIEDERERMLGRAHEQIIQPLERFRKEHIGAVKEGKKKFDKKTAKFCQTQERTLSLSTKKPDAVFQEADAALDMAERDFCQASVEYVFLLQAVQERKKFELVETLLGFVFGWWTFHHTAHDVHADAEPRVRDLQLRIQRTRSNFEEASKQTEHLMKKMMDMRQMNKEGVVGEEGGARAGYVFLMEKKAFGTAWTKQYATYEPQSRSLALTPYNQINPKAWGSAGCESVCVCGARVAADCERRFCWEAVPEGAAGAGAGAGGGAGAVGAVGGAGAGAGAGAPLTLQALSEPGRAAWLRAIHNTPPLHRNHVAKPKTEGDGEVVCALDEAGFELVRRLIAVIEERGLHEQGLYRVAGVSSKVWRLVSLSAGGRLPPPALLRDPLQWETKTLTSALKAYLRSLPERLIPGAVHGRFVSAAKCERRADRVAALRQLVTALPTPHRDMLTIVLHHLTKVCAHSSTNLMTSANLAVCFGPTLLRAEQDTVASILELKFYNVLVETMLDHYSEIFEGEPPPAPPPAPPAPPAAHTRTQLALLPAHNGILRASPPGAGAGAGAAGCARDLHWSSGVSVGAGAGGRWGGAGPYGALSTGSAVSALSTGSAVSALSTGSAVSALSTGSALSAVSASSGSEPDSVSSHSASPPPRPPHFATAGVGVGQWLRVRTLYACLGESEGELSFEPNQIITNVARSAEPGWLRGTLNGRTGLVPENYVEPLP